MEKLIVITFAGRRRYMEILFKYIEKYKNHIDEYHIYLATQNMDDIGYIQDFQSKNKNFVKIIKLEDYTSFDKSLVWNLAYKNCQEENAIYLKLDDDIVYFDESLFTDFIPYRIQNLNPPLLYPVIINNHFMSWMLQEFGIYNPDVKSEIGNTWATTLSRVYPYIVENKKNKLRVGDFIRDEEILCPMGWGNLKYCYDLHDQFLQDMNKNNIHKYKFGSNVTLNSYFAVSINACSWIGSDFKNLKNTYAEMVEDEPWWSLYIPIWTGRANEIYGNCVVSHYSYYRQRELGLDSTDILDRYYEYVHR